VVFITSSPLMAWAHYSLLFKLRYDCAFIWNLSSNLRYDELTCERSRLFVYRPMWLADCLRSCVYKIPISSSQQHYADERSCVKLYDVLWHIASNKGRRSLNTPSFCWWHWHLFGYNIVVILGHTSAFGEMHASRWRLKKTSKLLVGFECGA
jgi:hypothetical protein